MCVSKSILKYFSIFPLWSLLSGLLVGVYLADQFGMGSWGTMLLFCLSLSFVVRKRFIYMLSSGLLLGHLTHGTVIESQHECLKQADIGEKIIRAVVIDTGKLESGPYIIKVLEAKNFPTGTRLLLSQPKRQDVILKHGDIISTKGRFKNIGSIRNPYEFDRKEWLYRQGVTLIFTPSEKLKLSGTSWQYLPFRTMAKWRQHIRSAITLSLEQESKQAQLIRAVVLGERPPRDSAMIHDFRESGTLHVFAVSGLHVGMVGAIISLVLWFFRLPRWAVILGTILCMSVYAGITGMNAPAVRAVIMATVFLSGFLVQRKPVLVNSLAASAIIVLLFDGHQLFTTGFQLSYGVLLAIALATGMWTRVFKPLGEIDSFFPRPLLNSKQEFLLEKRRWLRGSLAVSMAAWMGSAPLMWLHFGIVTPIAIIAGIPLMLIVFLILALAMLSLAVGALWQPAGDSINSLNSRLATTTYTLAAAFADIPSGHHYRKPNNNGKHHIIVFDLPYGGGAQFLDVGGGILLDCGHDDTFRRHVLPTLGALRARPDSLIISHADVKHCGAMSQCLKFYDVKQSLIPRTDLRSPSYKKFVKNALAHKSQLITPSAGQIFQIEPEIFLETLHAPREIDGSGRADDTGLVLRLHCHGWRILFTGDAGYATEDQLLSSGIDLSADIIVMGRNRDDFTGSQSFLQAVQPNAIISTNATFPQMESIPKTWKKHLKLSNIDLFDQQLTGAVIITIDKGSLTLSTTLEGTPPLMITRE